MSLIYNSFSIIYIFWQKKKSSENKKKKRMNANFTNGSHPISFRTLFFLIFTDSPSFSRVSFNSFVHLLCFRHFSRLSRRLFLLLSSSIFVFGSENFLDVFQVEIINHVVDFSNKLHFVLDGFFPPQPHSLALLFIFVFLVCSFFFPTE